MKRYRFEAPLQRSTGWGVFVFFPHYTPTVEWIRAEAKA
jgi:hypothetical protein